MSSDLASRRHDSHCVEEVECADDRFGSGFSSWSRVLLQSVVGSGGARVATDHHRIRDELRRAERDRQGVRGLRDRDRGHHRYADHLHVAREPRLSEPVRPGQVGHEHELPGRAQRRGRDDSPRPTPGAWSAKTPIGMVNHFGVHVNGTPGVQRYSWLCDLGGSVAGSTGILTPYGGTTQGNYFTTAGRRLGRPGWSRTPTGEAVRTVVAPAVVTRAGRTRFPDAVWVVKYQASSPNPVDVDQLLTHRSRGAERDHQLADLVGRRVVPARPGHERGPGDRAGRSDRSGRPVVA